MRLLLARDTRYDADVRCRTVVEAKRVLTERPVSKLLLACRCNGRDSGIDIIDWAFRRNRLPEKVTLVERNPAICRLMGAMLTDRGYQALDMRNYVSTGE